MAAGTSPIFVTTPRRPQGRVSTANTNRDGTGTLATICTAGANGDLYRRVRIMPEVAITAGDVVRLFNQVGGSGNFELIAEITIPPQNLVTSGAGTPPTPVLQPVYWQEDPNDPTLPLILGAADVFKASTDQGKTYSIALLGGGSY